MSVNKAILVGRLGKDPEVRYTAGGKAVANFSLATDETSTKDGEKQKKTEWHKIVAWEKLAEIVEQYVKKGDLIYVEGRIQTKSWEKDGTTHYDKEIVCNTLRMLGGNNREEKEEKATPAAKPRTSKPKRQEINDEDIPF